MLFSRSMPTELRTVPDVALRGGTVLLELATGSGTSSKSGACDAFLTLPETGSAWRHGVYHVK